MKAIFLGSFFFYRESMAGEMYPAIIVLPGWLARGGGGAAAGGEGVGGSGKGEGEKKC